MGLLRNAGKNLMLSLASILATLLLLELAFWTYVQLRSGKAAKLFLEPERATYPLDFYASDGQTLITPPRHRLKDTHGYTIHPYLIYRMVPDQHYPECHINTLGMRGPEITREKPADVFRVIITGGSSAFSMLASNDEATWPARLEKKLNACGAFPRRVEVINAGVVGYMIKQELLYLQLELLDLSPDLVVSFTGANDYIPYVEETQGCTHPISEMSAITRAGHSPVFYDLSYRMEEHAIEQSGSVTDGLRDLWQYGARRTRTAKFLHNRLQALRRRTASLRPGPGRALADTSPPVAAGEPAVNAECRNVIAANFGQTLQKMARLLDRRSVPLLAVQQPLIWQKPALAPAEAARLDPYRASGWYQVATDKVYPHMAQAAEAVAAAHPRMRFLETKNVFRDFAEQAFADEYHLTDRGNEVMAQFLADYLCKYSRGFR